MATQTVFPLTDEEKVLITEDDLVDEVGRLETEVDLLEVKLESLERDNEELGDFARNSMDDIADMIQEILDAEGDELLRPRVERLIALLRLAHPSQVSVTVFAQRAIWGF